MRAMNRGLTVRRMLLRAWTKAPLSSRLRSLVKTLAPGLRASTKRAVRLLAVQRVGRRLLNRGYHHLGWQGRAAAFGHYGEALATVTSSARSGHWSVRLAGVEIRLPLRPLDMGLDWGLALATLGHEPEIKITYETLLVDPGLRPRMFIDIGANHGTHSLIFLASGVATVSFEPNPGCHAYLVEAATLNGLTPWIEAMALGEKEGTTSLHFPPGETWLGTTDAGVANQACWQEVHVLHVPSTTLDTFVARSEARPDLVKIDAEGSETAILRGALDTLERDAPLVLLEVWRGEQRAEMWAVLAGAGYAVADLPLLRRQRPSALREEDFLASPRTNFLAFDRNGRGRLAGVISRW